MPVRGRGAWTPALHEEHPGGVIQKYVALRKPGYEKAIALLKDIGQSVKTLIQLRGWRTLAILTQGCLSSPKYTHESRIC